MPARTMCFLRIYGSKPHASKQVSLLGNRLQMVRVYATSNTTYVI